MSATFRYINEIEQLSKINVENALQCAKQQLIETIIQTGDQVTRQFEESLRNKVIEQIGLPVDEDEHYGKMTNLPKYIDEVDDILSWLLYSTVGYVISKDSIGGVGSYSSHNDEREKYKSLFKDTGENSHFDRCGGYDNNYAYCRSNNYHRRNQPGLDRQPCQYKHNVTSSDSKLMFVKKQFLTEIKKILPKGNNEYIINFITIIDLNKNIITHNSQYYSPDKPHSVTGTYFSGKLHCIIATNLTNFYIFECDLDKCGKCGCDKGSDCKNKQPTIKKSSKYPDIVTNTKMNKIFIDIFKSFKPLMFQYSGKLLTDGQYYVYSDLELNQIDNYTTNHLDTIYNQCRVISEKIKTYWGSSGLGTHSIHFEETFDSLQKAKSQIQTLENETEIKNKEIAKLKQENEDLRKQLENVEMFKRCVEMMQKQQTPIANTDQLQIGNPF